MNMKSTLLILVLISLLTLSACNIVIPTLPANYTPTATIDPQQAIDRAVTETLAAETLIAGAVQETLQALVSDPHLLRHSLINLHPHPIHHSHPGLPHGESLCRNELPQWSQSSLRSPCHPQGGRFHPSGRSHHRAQLLVGPHPRHHQRCLLVVGAVCHTER
jgi:hypothetical protein